MGEGYRFEILFREAMNCNRPESLLTFGGIINAGAIEKEGGLCEAVIAVMASMYPNKTYGTCKRIDEAISRICQYRGVSIDDIPEHELDNLYNEIEEIITELQ